MMGLKFTNLVVIGRVSWSESPQCNPRSDGVLWIISSEYGLKHLMDNVVDSTGVDMQAHEVDMLEAT
jgi:hypothetical protein